MKFLNEMLLSKYDLLVKYLVASRMTYLEKYRQGPRVMWVLFINDVKIN